MNPPLKFVAIASNDYGGIGFEFYSAVVRPYFEGLREKEEAPGWGFGLGRTVTQAEVGVPAESQHHDSQG
jgi:hypothetical protein